MPRLTVPNKMKTYTEADLRTAISKVADEGQSVNSAAKEMGVPGETLGHWVKKGELFKFGSSGKTTLPVNEF